MGESSPRFAVLKFGGTSVARLARWQTIADAARAVRAEGLTPVLVCSALAGVTDQLEALLRAVLEGGHEEKLAALEARHRDMAAELGLDPDPAIEGLLGDLSKLVLGASLVGEVSPRLRARVMAAGELLSTRLGAAYLGKALGDDTKVAWEDARQLLTSRAPARDARTFLSAEFDYDEDPDLRARFAAGGAQVVVTQGFIGRCPDGETVLLGRGGSDTSATVFAARLGAARCEIWTDVPGIYTADPREVPSARLLRSCDYDEAQEIATCGAKVLHPRCLPPARAHQIPIWIRCTPRPELEGTRITTGAGRDRAGVKVLSVRKGVSLVSMSTLGMWQQVGFLADAFGCFKKHSVSVDLVSTSETNVTASFDASELDDERLRSALLEDLSEVCQARLIGPCAQVSLVGRAIRSILHQLGPALEVFEEHRIHLVSQAASDLNLTFVVDEAQAPRLLAKLHALLFDGSGDELLGPTWAEQLGEPTPEVPVAPPWWTERRAALIEAAEAGTPAYVYDDDTLSRRARSLLSLKSVDRVFFAIKANSHPDILRRLYGLGLGLECVSPGELAHVFDVVDGVDPDRVLYTPNFAPKGDYADGFARGVRVNIDSVYPLEKWPEVFAGQKVMLRLDPGRGQGHHAHVRTAGSRSKFGIVPEEIGRAREAVATAGCKVVGLHAHAGSGILDPSSWRQTAMFLLEMSEQLGGVESLDLGGGLGVVEKPGQRPLDLSALDEALLPLKAAHPGIEFWLEPGRFLVSEAGVLLARVTQTKRKGPVRYVGVDAGMHTLIRPALYGAWHEIANLSRLDDEKTDVVNVVGPICETGDTLGRARKLPPTVEGDVLLVATAGAYGQVMSSNYNLRGRAREVLLRG